MLTWDWKWSEGRQGTGYRKLLILQGSWWDCWLIYYPPAASIPVHTDPVKGKRHYRFNVRLKGNDSFICMGGPYWRWWRFVLFRPDIQQHAVAYRSDSPSRWVLSIGWVR